MNKRRYLPSLGSFATFEVAAKHLSFTAAGNELNVTQAAISQQIRGLEKALGVALFHRKHNTLELTAAGERLLAAVSRGLDSICEGIDEIDVPNETAVITCSGTQAGVAFWIKPYVDRFRTLMPDVRFVLLASDEDDTLRNFEEVDVSMICGNERCEVGETLYYLFPEIVQPVCSPDFLCAHGPFDTPEALYHVDLLDLHRMHWRSDAIGWYPLSWADWFHANNCAMAARPARLVSNNYPLLVDAAVAGEGVVLGWHHLVRARVAEGALCAIFDKPLRVDRGNYLKVSRTAMDSFHVQQFVELILTDAATVDKGALPEAGLAGLARPPAARIGRERHAGIPLARRETAGRPLGTDR